MTYINNTCADAGTVNCPCPLAETGDCLICSRLAGRRKCDCNWAGLCIYNEFIQNDGKVRNKRNDVDVEIISKTWYSSDLLVLVLKVPRGMALSATMPGTFVFLNGVADNPFYNVPISIMASDVQKAHITLAIKVISAKTKAVADAKGSLRLRGVYRSGLIGLGREGLSKKEHWLILAKGVGFAPAVNLLRWKGGEENVRLIVDPEKITEEFVWEQLRYLGLGADENLTVIMKPLAEMLSLNEVTEDDNDDLRDVVDEYHKTFILASDYYIQGIKAALKIPESKLIYSNNFHMCCGEGICGACSHIDEEGNITKMCKCRQKV